MLDKANRVLSEMQATIEELAAMYARGPEREFAQDKNGALYLRRAEEAPPGQPEGSGGYNDSVMIRSRCAISAFRNLRNSQK